ncbi:hypothetical protein [Clostridium sp. MCC345]|uniref:hypothetical protein n=1 Tax=Clostridium sp. MCC345 TaxID=2592645 RepID=UPI001C03332A|nr:hypothetical protein [Clostridium sp. MCC345]
MNIEISKERMLEMAKKLASMDFCPEQKVFYKNILRMVKADAEGRLLVLPCRVGDTVYEILEETVPNHHFYIGEYEVQDVSVKAVKYADEWESYDYENLYFTREEAEAALKKRRNNKNA